MDKFDYEHRYLPKALREELRKKLIPEVKPIRTVSKTLYFSRCRISK